MKAPDTDARLRALFENHYDEVLAYCVRRLGRTHADEVAAEVFAIAWKRFDEIDWTTVRPWLYGLARGVVANRWRSIVRHRRLARKMSNLAPTTGEGPEVLVVQRERDREVIHTLRKLRGADQEVLMLSTWEGLTAREIGSVFGISTTAAEQRIHRARRRFAQALGPDQERFSRRAAEERGGS